MLDFPSLLDTEDKERMQSGRNGSPLFERSARIHLRDDLLRHCTRLLVGHRGEDPLPVVRARDANLSQAPVIFEHFLSAIVMFTASYPDSLANAMGIGKKT